MNYCRQILQHFSTHGYKSKIEGLCGLWASGSVKFLLPPGGLWIDDPELRGIDESLPLRLPYQSIALEYLQLGRDQATKHVIFAQQIDAQGKIFLYDAVDIGGSGWQFMDFEFSIPMEGYLDRSSKGYMGYPVLRLHDRDTGWLPPDSNYGIQRVLFAFLNGLSCSNVHIEKKEPKSSGKKIKASLPFDTYHYLTIEAPCNYATGAGRRGGSHRSPREHMRRGHIRRLEDRKIWVNATVVNAGSTGKIHKDYKVA